MPGFQSFPAHKKPIPFFTHPLLSFRQGALHCWILEEAIVQLKLFLYTGCLSFIQQPDLPYLVLVGQQELFFTRFLFICSLSLLFAICVRGGMHCHEKLLDRLVRRTTIA
jgi:hypothetical protein